MFMIIMWIIILYDCLQFVVHDVFGGLAGL